jgi:tRNA (cytidine/uridine-2'-O-)-methyltransferase
MKKGHLHVCLLWPEIPQNTGSIGRLVAATQCRLHIVRPTGFSLDDRNLRRAGLDYWPFLDLEIHDSLDPLLARFSGRFAFFSKKAPRLYCETPTTTELLIFGQETKGLPTFLADAYPEAFHRIPMFHEGIRSLNLSNAVSIVLYHQLEKRGLFRSE